MQAPKRCRLWGKKKSDRGLSQSHEYFRVCAVVPLVLEGKIGPEKSPPEGGEGGGLILRGASDPGVQWLGSSPVSGKYLDSEHASEPRETFGIVGSSSTLNSTLSVRPVLRYASRPATHVWRVGSSRPSHGGTYQVHIHIIYI